MYVQMYMYNGKAFDITASYLWWNGWCLFKKEMKVFARDCILTVKSVGIFKCRTRGLGTLHAYG